MKHLILGTAGHIDHGKTSLIQALSGKDCDSHPEEKKRGITINLGFSYLNYEQMSIGIIDMPGHKDFVNTMIRGANSIDMALLVIAADSGIMPQTIEHINIIRSLGIKHIIVALNKADLVDDELLDLAKEEIEQWFKLLYAKDNGTEYQIVSCSALQSESIDLLNKAIEEMAQRVQAKPLGKIFRMYIDRWFSVKGLGSVVTGSVLSGKVRVNDELILLPDNEKCKIKSIERHSAKVEEVSAGDRAAFNLGGIHKKEWRKGMLLSDQIGESTQMIDASIQLFEQAPTLSLWSKIMFYSGTYESAARMHLLNQDEITQGEEAIVQIHLEKPALLINKDRFVIRNSSGDATIGGGFILDAQALHHRKRRPELIENLKDLHQQMLSQASFDSLLKLKLSQEQLPLSISELAQIFNEDEASVKEQIDNSSKAKYFEYAQKFYVFDEGKAENLKSQILQLITDYHQQNSLLKDGVNSNWLGSQLFPKLKHKIIKPYIEQLCKALSNSQKIEYKTGTWIIKGHQINISPAQAQALEKIENKIRSFGLQKPIFKELIDESRHLSISSEQLKLFLKYLIEQKKILKYQDDYVHADNLEQVKQLILPLLEKQKEGINLSDFRQISQCAKKAIPLFVGLLEQNKLVQTRAEGSHTIMFI